MTGGVLPGDVERLVRQALEEDLGLAGDVTSALTVPADAAGVARIVAREGGVVSGTAFVIGTYAVLDPAVDVRLALVDGQPVTSGQLVAEVTGPARSVLAGERVALNFLGHLSGVASATRRMVDLVGHTRTRICDTRKTVPGLRAAQKRAVRDGGGVNHRFGLHDAVLVKDNHIGLGGGLAAVLERLSGSGHLVAVEVEVDTLGQLRDVLAAEADRLGRGEAPAVQAVLLDNMSPDDLATAITLVRDHPTHIVTEASGGVDETTIAAIAEAGPDLISVGALTHSVRSLDVALDLPDS